MKKKPEQQFDELLVTQMQLGDKKAMQLFIKRWHSTLYQRICYLTNDGEIAKDLVQEAWSGILKNINTLQNISGFKSWIMTIASRKAYDWIRKKSKDETISIESVAHSIEESTADDVDKIDVIHKLREIIRGMDSSQRIILSMYYLENKSLVQISMELEIPKGTVKSRLFYARERLKTKIKEVHDET